MVPPYSASLHRLRHLMFDFVLFLVIFLFLFMIVYIIFAPLSLPSLGSLVLALPAGHRNDCSFQLCVAALFSSFPCFSVFFFLRSVWSCRAVFLLVHHLDISQD